MSEILQDTSQAFASTGYALFNIEAHIVCIIILAILFNRQQNSSDQTEARVIWSRLLFIQILYCISGVLRVLVDINIIARSNISQYVVTGLNFGLFGCLCWLVFMYIIIYQKSDLLNSIGKKFLAACPFIFNVIMLMTSPFTGAFIDISGPVMKTGFLFSLMVAINLCYPLAAVIIAIMLRSRMTRYERDVVPVMAIYPAFFMICGPLQAFNWRMPFLCYAIVISDIFVYISYADSLISVDPLTKIPNRNGLMHSLSERMNAGPKNLEKLYVFAIDIDELSSINSHYGRTAGDRVLTIIAEALRKLSEEDHACYFSRYYEDEFIIFTDIENEDELELFTEHIKNYVRNRATKSGIKYPVKINIGWAKYEQYSRTETISGLIGEAYRMLNENMKRKKFMMSERLAAHYEA